MTPLSRPCRIIRSTRSSQPTTSRVPRPFRSARCRRCLCSGRTGEASRLAIAPAGTPFLVVKLGSAFRRLSLAPSEVSTQATTIINNKRIVGGVPTPFTSAGTFTINVDPTSPSALSIVAAAAAAVGLMPRRRQGPAAAAAATVSLSARRRPLALAGHSWWRWRGWLGWVARGRARRAAPPLGRCCRAPSSMRAAMPSIRGSR